MAQRIENVKYLISAYNKEQFPRQLCFEVAFFGRSNVGKSSLLNTYTGHKKMAKVSAKPGCTREINFFLVENKYYLVDLPGYGYAKYSKVEQQHWAELIDEYLTLRQKSILGVVILDIRRQVMESDILLFELLNTKNIDFIIVTTKIDKLNKNEVNSSILQIKNQLKSLNIEKEIIKFSAITLEGKKELYNLINKKYEEYKLKNSNLL